MLIKKVERCFASDHPGILEQNALMILHKLTLIKRNMISKERAICYRSDSLQFSDHMICHVMESDCSLILSLFPNLL